MAKLKKTEITVLTIFEGTQTGRQAFINLIKVKNKVDISKDYIDNTQVDVYNVDKVNSDVRQIERG